METAYEPGELTLHVFELDDSWQWALTVERSQGVGHKIVAYSDVPFESEAQARMEGSRACDAAPSGAHGT